MLVNTNLANPQELKIIPRKMRLRGVDYKDVGIDSEEATIKRGERYPILAEIFASVMK